MWKFGRNYTKGDNNKNNGTIIKTIVDTSGQGKLILYPELTWITDVFGWYTWLLPQFSLKSFLIKSSTFAGRRFTSQSRAMLENGCPLSAVLAGWLVLHATLVRLKHRRERKNHNYILFFGITYAADWVATRVYRDLDAVDMQVFRLEWRWGVTWVELRRISGDMDGGETGPGCSLNVNGWTWDVYLGTWVEVRRGLDGSKTPRLYLLWDGTYNELGCNFLDLEVRSNSLDLDGGETERGRRRDAWGTGWRWDGIWMECTSRCTMNNVWVVCQTLSKVLVKFIDDAWTHNANTV